MLQQDNQNYRIKYQKHDGQQSYFLKENAFYSRYKAGYVTTFMSSCRRAAFHQQVLPRTSCSHRRCTAMLPVPPHWKPASAASAPGIQRRRPAAANRPWKPAARAPTRGQQPSAEPTSWHQNPAAIPTQTRQTSTTSALLLKLFGLRNLCVPGGKKHTQQVGCKDLWEMQSIRLGFACQSAAVGDEIGAHSHDQVLISNQVVLNNKQNSNFTIKSFIKCSILGNTASMFSSTC